MSKCVYMFFFLRWIAMENISFMINDTSIGVKFILPPFPSYDHTVKNLVSIFSFFFYINMSIFWFLTTSVVLRSLVSEYFLLCQLKFAVNRNETVYCTCHNHFICTISISKPKYIIHERMEFQMQWWKFWCWIGYGVRSSRTFN